MVRRSTWILLLIFILLAGAAWALNRFLPKDNAQPGDAQETPGRLFSFTESDVTGLRVSDAAGVTVALQKDASGQWALSEPPAEQTDTERASQAVNQLATLDIVTRLDPDFSLDQGGLVNPAYILAIDLADGKKINASIGRETTIGTGYYVKVDDEPVQVVRKFGLDNLLRLLDEPPVVQTPTPEPTPGVEATGEGVSGEETTPTTAP
jgi:hypothetical protein